MVVCAFVCLCVCVCVCVRCGWLSVCLSVSVSVRMYERKCCVWTSRVTIRRAHAGAYLQARDPPLKFQPHPLPSCLGNGRREMWV